MGNVYKFSGIDMLPTPGQASYGSASVAYLPNKVTAPRVPSLESALDDFRREVLAAQFVVTKAQLEALGCVVGAQQTLKEAMLEHTLEGNDEEGALWLEAQEQSSTEPAEFLAS